CRLEGNSNVNPITAYTGRSVLLRCSCTDLNTTPVTFTWERNTNENVWVEIWPKSEKYRDRVQLVNDHSSGNLSLLISHLTEEDGGDYRCRLSASEAKDIRLTVKGCNLDVNSDIKVITAYTGDSVLLPCSCTDLQTTPVTFTWKKNKMENDWEVIFPGSDQYKNRVQLVNDHPPGNLSLLISHLNEEDGGWYRCQINNNYYKDVSLSVKEATMRPSTLPSKTKPTSTPGATHHCNTQSGELVQVSPESLPFVPFAVVAVIFLHIIVAVVYWRTRKK
ncbi:polymeric immunoglobulin receptor-like, partial [Clarias magur]